IRPMLNSEFLIPSRGDGTRQAIPPGKLVFLNIPFQEMSADLQYCRHFTTSLTASEPAGTSYSNSIVAGMVHLFFFTVWRISFTGVSPVPHGRFFAPCSGVVRSFK